MLEDKTFWNGSSPPSWTSEVCDFLHLTWINEWFCFFVPNLYQNRTRFRWDLANLERLCSSLNFENFDFFLSRAHSWNQNMHLHMYFFKISICRWESDKVIFKMASLRMWNLQILYFVYVICVTAWFCVYGPNFTFSRQKTPPLRYNRTHSFQYGGCLSSWMLKILIFTHKTRSIARYLLWKGGWLVGWLKTFLILVAPSFWFFDPLCRYPIPMGTRQLGCKRHGVGTISPFRLAACFMVLVMRKGLEVFHVHIYQY